MRTISYNVIMLKYHEEMRTINFYVISNNVKIS